MGPSKGVLFWVLGSIAIVLLFETQGFSYKVDASLTVEGGNNPDYKVRNFENAEDAASLSYELNLRNASADGGNKPKIWAVLVAGSNGFYNYRHQSDVCHAYQILVRNGVPRENILVMMYDDIAHSKENPTPGVILNHPAGPNVYEGVAIDYKGEDVNPEVFQKVLLGDVEGLAGIGTGRVLKSGPEDHVFVNFVDHGAPGLVAFPSEELYARDLLTTLKTMHHKKSYGKLVFYLEACESGSMFKNLLPPHWNMFATTAANEEESSYACYMDDLRNTYLGDVYSVMWMENADQVDLDSETIQSQFLVVRNETNTSHVQEFGDRRLRTLPVADFLGESSPEIRTPLPKVPLNAVASEDVVPTLLKRKLALANTTEAKREAAWQLKRLYKMRKVVRTDVKEIVSVLTGGGAKEMETLMGTRMALTNWDCYERIAKHFSKVCYSIAKNAYVTRNLFVLVNLCERGLPAESIVQAMSNTCRHPNFVGIH